jgi:uncharacterized membrane protein (GlpM family)
MKKIAVAVFVSIAGLLVITPLLVCNFDWLFAGHVIFGLTTGLMVGMTKSPVVSGVLPLLFTFAGGSIVALSIGADRTEEQLYTLGKQLVGFGIGTSVGLLVGIFLSKMEIQLPLGPEA